MAQPSPLGWLESASTGDVLGVMSRAAAGLAHTLHGGGEVGELVWNGWGLEGTLVRPYRRVVIEQGARGPEFRCTTCGDGRQACAHAGAVLLRWLEVRQPLIEGGPGSSWRKGMAQAFRSPAKAGTVQRVRLGHDRVGELLPALRFQLALMAHGGAEARLVGDTVEVRGTTGANVERIVSLPVARLPEVLGELVAAPGVQTTGDLARATVSRALPVAVLRATVLEDGSLELLPGFRLSDGRLLPAESGENGDWLRDGLTFHPRPLVPIRLRGYFQSGRRVLVGEAAVRFLATDDFFLRGEPGYEPRGALSEERPRAAELMRIELEGEPGGDVRVRPQFGAAGRPIGRDRQPDMLAHGFVEDGGRVVLAPSLEPLDEAGLRRRRGDLVGDRLAALRLASVAGVPVRASQEDLAALIGVLDPPPPPDAFQAPPGLLSTLRPYQRTGAAWLLRLYHTRLGALLADEMGLGKTHQVMALLSAVHDVKPHARFLVVCPRGVLEHWRHLLESFAPRLPVVLFHGPQRSLEEVPGGAVVLTTYDVALRSAARLMATTWEIAVFDEAQRAKNPRTKGARAVRAIPAAFRVALSGTPVENSLRELWSVVDLVVPGYLGTERAFVAAFRDPSPTQLERLKARVAPFTLRRLKTDVLSDLPEKLEEVVYCELGEEQGRLYREIHAAGAGSLAPALADRRRDIPFVHVFALLTRLKQACDHPRLVEPRSRALPGKLELLDELLDEALEAGNRVVVFSQYVRMIDLLAAHLRARGLDHLVLTGRTRDRGAVIDRFNGKAAPVLLASLLASGVGIDLTAASVVVHYDRWWNPAKEDQASDRVHRIGQKRAVQVFKLVTTGTIEERIEAILARKSELARAVIAPSEEVLRSLSREELADLLGIRLPAQGTAT